MKKLMSFVLSAVMCVGFFGCGTTDDENSDMFFDAEVLDVREENILVKPIGGKDVPSADEVVVSTNISGTNEVPKMEKGTEIRIMYGGEIEETSPEEITTVFAIYLLDDIK